MLTKKITVIAGLNLALPLLFGGLSLYAASEAGGNGDIVPSLTYIDVVGDKEKFAEDHWIQRGFSGGVSEYNYINENKHGDSVVTEGKVIAGNNDYDFNFDLKREGFGSLLFEFKQFRKYYDGTGGFYAPFLPTAASPKTYFETDRDLFLDIGNLKVEAVMSKEESTKCTFSYEREYRKGAKSLISWGPVTGLTTMGTTLTRYILPTFLQTDEIVDKLHLKLEHTVNGIDISAEQTWEKIKVESQKVNNRTLTLSTGLFTLVRQKFEDLDSDIYTTVVRVSKDLNDKIFVSSEFLFNHYRGHTIETVTDTSVSAFNENNPNSPARVEEDTITVLPKISIQLLENVLMNAGLRWEFVNKNGSAHYNRDKTNPPDGILDEIMIIKTETGEQKLGESIDFKYDGIKNVVFFTGANLEQQTRNQNEKQDSRGSAPTGSNNFGRDSDIYTYDYDTNVGVKWYPVQRVDITTEFNYKYGRRDMDNGDNKINQVIDVQNGYRGYLQDLAFTTYRPIVTFNFKLLKWLAYNFRYIYDTTIYGVSTQRAEDPELSKYRAHTYSTGITITPYDCLYLTCFYQHKQASTLTPDNGGGGPGTNLPTYNANYNAFSTSFAYSPVKNITIRGSYSLSKVDNFNNYSSTGIPYGLNNLSQDASIGFENKITRDISLEFKYDYLRFNEDSNAGIDNYSANAFYTALKAKF